MYIHKHIGSDRHILSGVCFNVRGVLQLGFSSHRMAWRSFHVSAFCIYLFFFKTKICVCGKIDIKFTILKCIIQWHLLHSQCCVTITSIEFQNISVTPKGKPHTHSPTTSHPPGHPQLLTIPNLLSVSVVLCALDISYLQNHIICGALCLASLTCHVSKVHPHHSMYQH